MKLSDCCGCPADDNKEIGVCPCCSKPCDFISEEDINRELDEFSIDRDDAVNDVKEEHPELNVFEG